MTTVKITKKRQGRYGTRSVASVPKIAGGYGSVRFFSLLFNKGYKNKRFLFAKCTDGKLQAKATSIFTDGTRMVGSFVRPCTPKG